MANKEYLKKNVTPVEFSLQVTGFHKGKCFICNTECEKESYVHHSCGIAFTDYKDKLIKKWLAEEESKKTVKQHRGEIIK